MGGSEAGVEISIQERAKSKQESGGPDEVRKVRGGLFPVRSVQTSPFIAVPCGIMVRTADNPKK